MVARIVNYIKMLILSAIFFLADYWVVLCGGAVIILFGLWVYGYMQNGDKGAHFDLASAWVGVGVMTSAGCLGLGKYLIDSIKNTPKEIAPPMTLRAIKQGDDKDAQ